MFSREISENQGKVESEKDEENKILDFDGLYRINQYERAFKYGGANSELDVVLGLQGGSAEESSDRPKLEQRIRRPPAILPFGKNRNSCDPLSGSRGKKDPKTPLTTFLEFSPKLLKKVVRIPEKTAQQQDTCHSRDYRARPYVMRKVKEALKLLFEIQNIGILKEKSFTKNINEDFYLHIFSTHSRVINKQLLFERVRQEIRSGTNSPLEMKELRKVERNYTFTNKEIQKVMWGVLGNTAKKQSYNCQEYREISISLKESSCFSVQAFWIQVIKELQKKSETKYDRFQIERIRDQYFDED